MLDKLKQMFSGRQVPRHATTVTFEIEGMSCHHCAMNIQNRFAEVAGVYLAEVSFPEGKGTFAFDPEQITPQQLIAIIEEGGSYKVRHH